MGMSQIHALWSEVDKKFVFEENTTQENSTDKPNQKNQHHPEVQSAKDNLKKENVKDKKEPSKVSTPPPKETKKNPPKETKKNSKKGNVQAEKHSPEVSTTPPKE